MLTMQKRPLHLWEFFSTFSVSGLECINKMLEDPITKAIRGQSRNSLYASLRLWSSSSNEFALCINVSFTKVIWLPKSIGRKTYDCSRQALLRKIFVLTGILICFVYVTTTCTPTSFAQALSRKIFLCELQLVAWSVVYRLDEFQWCRI